MYRRFKLLLLLMVLLACSGCSLLPGVESLPMHRQVAPLPAGQLCRVAVLPFLNDSDFPSGDVLVQKVFAAQLQHSGDHIVIQEGEIVKAYQQLRLWPGAAPSLGQMQIVADRVNAQLLLTGVILEMREDRSEHQTVNPLLILEVQLRDAATGEILWTAFHRRKGTDYKKTMHFGTIHTLTGLARQMAEEIFTLWYRKGFAQCKG